VYRHVEVLAGAGRRRQWLREAKALIVLQAMQPAIPRWTVRLAMPISSTPHAAIGPATQSLTVNEAQQEAIARGIRDADTRPPPHPAQAPGRAFHGRYCGEWRANAARANGAAIGASPPCSDAERPCPSMA
jgi:hypothetical protein